MMQEDINPADPNAATIQLLEALASGDDSKLSPDALIKTMASQGGDPTTSMLASLLMTGLSEEDGDEDEEVDEIERLLAFCDSDEASENAPDDDMRDELEALREVNDTLASALGACPACWGGDDRCNVCGGDGSPGAHTPDQRLFDRLILPSVRRVNQSRRTKSKAATHHANPATKEVHHG